MNKLHWWEFSVVIASIFIGCVLLHYIVNKINGVRLEKRLTALQLKSPIGKVTQVHAPHLETGEMTRHRFPILTGNCCGQEIKLHHTKDNFIIPETEAEITRSKPIFLGSIYRSSVIEVPITNGGIGKTERNKNIELYYCEDILNELLDRTMRIIDYIKPETDEIKVSRDTNADFLSTSLYGGIRNELADAGIIIDDILDNVMKEIHKKILSM